jgi:hypothetical protein
MDDAADEGAMQFALDKLLPVGYTDSVWQGAETPMETRAGWPAATRAILSLWPPENSLHASFHCRPYIVLP